MTTLESLPALGTFVDMGKGVVDTGEIANASQFVLLLYSSYHNKAKPLQNTFSPVNGWNESEPAFFFSFGLKKCSTSAFDGSLTLNYCWTKRYQLMGRLAWGESKRLWPAIYHVMLKRGDVHSHCVCIFAARSHIIVTIISLAYLLFPLVVSFSYLSCSWGVILTYLGDRGSISQSGWLPPYFMLHEHQLNTLAFTQG